MNGNDVKEYLLAHPELIQLLDNQEYDLLFNVLPFHYAGYLLLALHDSNITTDVSYSVWTTHDQRKKTTWAEYEPLINWSEKHIGKRAYWYITNDLTGEIVHINEEA